MSLKVRIKNYISVKKEQLERGKQVTLQMKDERLRKKYEKSKYYEPGTFRYGLVHKQNTWEFMHDVKKRREDKRKNK